MKSLGVLLLFLAVASQAFAEDISIEQIKTWADKKPELFKNITFFDSDRIKPIGLTNKNIAYLVPISLNHAGRNEMFQTALVVPSRQEVIPLAGTEIKQVEKITDVDGDGISEIYVKNTGSGQGSEMGEKSLVLINEDGKIIVLRKARYENNEGEWGTKVASYYSKDVSWVFTDSNMGKDIKDLVETITLRKGRKNKDPIVHQIINRYHFINAYLFKYEKPEPGL